MTWVEMTAWVLVALAALAIPTGMLLRSLALRVKRLDLRIEHARRRLDAELRTRAADALALASNADLPSGVSAHLADAARQVLELPLGEKSAAGRRDQADREAGESRLTAALRAALATGDLPDRYATAVLTANARADMARRLHNQAVVQARGLRSRHQITTLHLHGRSILPDTVEYSTDLPALPG